MLPIDPVAVESLLYWPGPPSRTPTPSVKPPHPPVPFAVSACYFYSFFRLLFITELLWCSSSMLFHLPDCYNYDLSLLYVIDITAHTFLYFDTSSIPQLFLAIPFHSLSLYHSRGRIHRFFLKWKKKRKKLSLIPYSPLESSTFI